MDMTRRSWHLPTAAGVVLAFLVLFAMATSAPGMASSAGPPSPPVGSSLEMDGSSQLRARLDLLGDNFPVAANTLVEVHPAVVYNPDTEQYLAVWHNDRPGNDDVRAQRIARDGKLLGGPFYVAAGPGYERRHPDVAYNVKHNEFLVVWEETQGGFVSIRGQRLDAGGQKLGAVIQIGNGSNIATLSNPAVAYAFTSDKYLVVWDEVFHPNPPSRSIMGRIVGSDGAAPNPSFAIAQGSLSDQRQRPALAYNRSRNEHLVVWQKLVAGDFDILARRVTGAGAPLPPPETIIGNYVPDDIAPDVAAIPTAPGGGCYLVVWEMAVSPGNNDIYVAQVDADGNLGNRGGLATSPRHQRMPTVAGSESTGRFLVAWREENYAPPSAQDGIVARHVAPDRTPIGDELVLQGAAAEHPDVCAGPLGDYLLVFDDYHSAATNRDVFARLEGNRVYLPLIRR